MHYYLKVLLIFKIVFTTVFADKAASRIVGGKIIDISKCGWQVSLQTFGQHLCGGSIINDHWILTAAQCVLDGHAETRSIRVGSSKHGSGGDLYNITKIVKHPKYDSETFDFDIALVRIDGTIKYKVCNTRPVKIIKEGLETPVGTLVQITGWGAEQAGGPDYPFLREAWTPIIEQEICKERYANVGRPSKVTDRMICAGFAEGGESSCTGDSGSPVMDKERNLIGVVSWGLDCGSANYPEVFTKISHPEIQAFIKENILF